MCRCVHVCGCGCGWVCRCMHVCGWVYVGVYSFIGVPSVEALSLVVHPLWGPPLFDDLKQFSVFFAVL